MQALIKQYNFVIHEQQITHLHKVHMQKDTSNWTEQKFTQDLDNVTMQL